MADYKKRIISSEEKTVLAKEYNSATNSQGQTLAELSAIARDFADHNNKGLRCGDHVIIEPGYAKPFTFKDQTGKEISYLGFKAKVQRNEESFECPVSINFITRKTFSPRLATNAVPRTLIRGQLKYRFGRQYDTSFDEVTLNDGTVVQLRCLDEKVDCILTEVAECADIVGSYIAEEKAYSISRTINCYAYAKEQ